MWPPTIEFYVCGTFLVAASARTYKIRQKVLKGKFGKFAFFEYFILPAALIAVGIVVYFLMHIDKQLAGGLNVFLSMVIGAMLVVAMPFVAALYVFFAYFIVLSWTEIVEIAASLFIGAAIGNMIGFGLGTAKRRKATRN